MKAGVMWLLLAVGVGGVAIALWQNQQGVGPAVPLQLSAAGLAAVELAKSRGCLACHSLEDSAGIGPGWAGSYGTARMLHDGSSVVMDETYLRLAMQDPAAQLVGGFQNVMVPANLADAEVTMLIDLIKELGNAP